MDDKERIALLENAVKEKDRALFYAFQRLETIEMFSKGEWDSKMTRKRIEMALQLGK
jgi:hypothetical protein